MISKINVKKILLLAIVMSAMLLAGCGRSDVVLTVNEDGSFKADISYGITKALMGNAEVQEQVKALITDSLDQSGINYTESENDEYVIISVEKEFEDISKLTSEEEWKGISFVPAFSSEESENKLWVRFENGSFKMDGVLNADVFGASELVNQSDMAASFGGSLTVVLPEAAKEYGEAQSDNASYKWSGTAEDSKTVALVSGESFKDPESDKQSGGKKRVSAIATVSIVILAAAILSAVALLKKKKTD